MNDAIEVMLARYKPTTAQDYENAMKEILQEIILLGLDRASFFEKAAFYGGTALRIFHGLDRFSEDLDFTLTKPDQNFKLERYFSSMERELKAFNFEFILERVDKAEDRLTESAFLKANTQLLFLQVKLTQQIAAKVQKNQKLKIKFEVDIDPAQSFQTEVKTLLLPTPFTVTVLTPSSLFAGKMHAVLFRKWKGRVKGRDFYDLQWYIARNIPLDQTYLREKMKGSGVTVSNSSSNSSKDNVIQLLHQRIESIDWDSARQDVFPFLKDKSQVRLWSSAFFKELVSNIRFT